MNVEQISGGNLIDVPNDKYKKFFEKFKEIETLNVEEWKVAHIVGYFAKKYQETYQTPFKFKFNSPSPSKCFEVFQIKKLSNLLTSQPKLLKNYIDWIFENKIIKAKKRITSISFLTHEDFMLEYRDTVLLVAQTNKIIDRSTNLPDDYKVSFNKVGFNINTFGELAFLSQMENKPSELILAFNEIENNGFDKNILGKIV